MELFSSDGHLTSQGLQSLIDEKLDELERLEVAEHLSFCDDCLVRYTTLLTDVPLLTPQEPFKKPVLRKIQEKKTFTVLQKISTIAAAVVLSAGLLTTGVFSTLASPVAPPSPKELSSFSTFVSQIAKEANDLFSQIGKPSSFNSNKIAEEALPPITSNYSSTT